MDNLDERTVRSNCSTGSVRLADQRIGSNTIQGRVEVCINQAWGTVCNSRFDQEDAGTACVNIGGYLRNGKVWPYLIEQSLTTLYSIFSDYH